MNLVAHLVRKDWDRVRLALLAWYALIAGKAWCVWQLSHSTGASSTHFAAVGSFVDLANGIEAVAGAFLAARLSFEDPPHQSQAFWRTRPISRGLLLRAKSVGAGLFFIAAPLLLLAPVWIAAAFSPGEFCAAALEWALVQGMFIAVGLLAGALARNLGEALVAVPVIGLSLLSLALYLRREPGPAVWLSASLVVVVSAIGIVVAYQGRRRIPAVAVAVIGFLVIAGLGLPGFAPPESMPVWPEASRALRVGDNRASAGRTWSLLKLEYDDRGRRTLLAQSTRPWSRLLPTSEPVAATHRFALGAPDDAGEIVLLVPERLVSIQTASLRITQWHLALPKNVSARSEELRLVAFPFLPSAP